MSKKVEKQQTKWELAMNSSKTWERIDTISQDNTISTVVNIHHTPAAVILRTGHPHARHYGGWTVEVWVRTEARRSKYVAWCSHQSQLLMDGGRCSSKRGYRRAFTKIALKYPFIPPEGIFCRQIRVFSHSVYSKYLQVKQSTQQQKRWPFSITWLSL